MINKSYYIDGELYFLQRKLRMDNEMLLLNLNTQQKKLFPVDYFKTDNCCIDKYSFFDMWDHFSKMKGFETDAIILNYIEYTFDLLKIRKIEMYGRDRFTNESFEQLEEMLNFGRYGIFSTHIEWKDIIHSIDGGYTYHNIFNALERIKYDRDIEMKMIIDEFITEEINFEILAAIKSIMKNENDN